LTAWLCYGDGSLSIRLFITDLVDVSLLAVGDYLPVGFSGFVELHVSSGLDFSFDGELLRLLESIYPSIDLFNSTAAINFVVLLSATT